MNRINPLDRYYRILNDGDMASKLAVAPDFPVMVDVELTNHCNFSCRMCETGAKTSPRAKGFMPDELFAKIIREMEGRKTSLRFIRWGEPTLHKSFPEFFLAAKKAGLPVQLITNGSLLDESLMTTLVDNELDAIKFSFQGVDRESYREMRDRDFFHQLLDIIHRFVEIRGDRPNPFIQISTTVTDEPLEKIDLFKELTSFADYVNIGRTDLDAVDVNKFSSEQRDRFKMLKLKQKPLIRRTNCAEVFAKLSINWDGQATACCADNREQMIVGDLRGKSIGEIFRSPAMKKYQTALVRGNFEASPLCARCCCRYYEEDGQKPL